MRLSLPLSCVCLLTVATSAKAAPLILPTWTQRIQLTGLYYTESQMGDSSLLSSPTQLAFGDLRIVTALEHLAKDRLDIRLDFRARATGNFNDQDYEFKFNEPFVPTQSVSARGYLGGPEFDLRELYLDVALNRRSATNAVSLRLGRMLIPEADVLKIDGARLSVALGTERHWGVAGFVGGYPNPYSRSVLSDYEPPCGAGVASDAKQASVRNIVPIAAGPCATPGSQLALVGGVAASYRYHSLWGSAGLVGSFFGSTGDGGPVVFDPGRTATFMNVTFPTVGNLQLPSNLGRDVPRVYLSWITQVTPIDRFDLLGNLVIDFLGSHGTQLTRALITGNVQLLRESRLNLRFAYSYMSSLAIDMFLANTLYNRTINGTTLGGMGIVENNLTVQRTGRHEGRLGLDWHVARQLLVYLDGRMRQRTLLDGDRNSPVFESTLYLGEQRSLAGDATVGFRDDGSNKWLRGSLSYTFLEDFRARSHVARANLGVVPWQPPDLDGLHFELEYSLLRIDDLGAREGACSTISAQPEVITGEKVYRLDPNQSLFGAGCFGRRQGFTHEVGGTMSLNPTNALFFYLDYRLTVSTTEPQMGLEIPTIIGHALLLRAEWRMQRSLRSRRK